MRARHLLPLLLPLLMPVLAADQQYIRPCYFTNGTQSFGFEPEDYVPGLCTHILFAFASISSTDFSAQPEDPTDEGLYVRVNALKRTDPGLRTLLSFGGASFGVQLFKNMTATAETRAAFIHSAVQYVRRFDFNGIDIDWEYPNDPIDKHNYIELLKELRTAAKEECEVSGKDQLLLTAAVAAGVKNIKKGYDIPAMAKYLDFVNLMSYDFHGPWDNRTGMSAPLYPQIGETEPLWSVTGAASYWSDHGMPRTQIVVGLPTYGHGWTLNGTTSAAAQAAAEPTCRAYDFARAGIDQPGTPSRPTAGLQEAGSASYAQLCQMLAAGAVRHFNFQTRESYLVLGDQWFSYDDPQAFRDKLAWIKANGFGGAFVWTMDMDDFSAKCPNSNGQRYPLIGTIAKDMGGLNIPGVTSPPAPYQTTPLDQFCAGQSDGFHAIKGTSSEFVLCLGGEAFKMQCPAGTEFCDDVGYCAGGDAGTTTTPYGAPVTSESTESSESSESHESTEPYQTTPAPTGQGFTCAGRADGFYADPANCDGFYRCVSQSGFRFNCAPGTAFNADTLECDTASTVQCS